MVKTVIIENGVFSSPLLQRENHMHNARMDGFLILVAFPLQERRKDFGYLVQWKW